MATPLTKIYYFVFDFAERITRVLSFLRTVGEGARAGEGQAAASERNRLPTGV